MKRFSSSVTNIKILGFTVMSYSTPRPFVRVKK